MESPRELVVAAFPDHARAEQAVHELLQMGIEHQQIYFAGPEASTGGPLGKAKSLFTRQESEAGKIFDTLVAEGTPEDDARIFQSEYEAGRSIVAVQTGGTLRTPEVLSTLTRHGGYGADQRRSSQATSSTAAPAATATGMQGREAQGREMREREAQDKQRLKLREEELQARKEPVETGEVRVRKEVVTEPKSVDIPVTHEEVYVERHPVAGQPSESGAPIGQDEGEVYRIPVREEQIQVEKRPVEREEVILGKQPVQEVKHVTEPTRREEARVEHEGDIDVRGREGEHEGEYREDINLPRRDLGGSYDQPAP